MSDMDITAADLAEFRAMAESMMVDSVVVTRIRRDESGNPIETIDEDGAVTVERDQVYPDPAWPDGHRWKRGPAKRQTAKPQEQNPEAGGFTFTTQRYEDHFPIGAFVPRVGDLVEWTACPNDPDRVGTIDRITAKFEKTYSTAMRLPVETGVEGVAS